MNKYKIAQEYLKTMRANSEFFKQLPRSIRFAYIDNELQDQQISLINFLLKQLLTPEQVEDLQYFAFEPNPKVFLDNKEFTDLHEYWLYRYNIE